jgi:hypothetical protein
MSYKSLWDKYYRWLTDEKAMVQVDEVKYPKVHSFELLTRDLRYFSFWSSLKCE